MIAIYNDLKNKRVFVTGGGSGIGASIVEHFCEQGSQVFFVDINEEASNQLVSKCKNKNLSVPNFIKCDLLNIKDLQNIISKIISDNGAIDILVNNAANDERHSIDEGLTRSFANDLGEFDIRVNSVVPGWVMTERQVEKWLTPESEADIMKKQCLKHKLMPSDIAKAVLFFGSDASSGCTNQDYVVDKGWL